MSTRNRWIAALLTLSALTACATTAPPGATVSTPRVNVTATRIALPVQPNNRLPQTASPTQVVTQDEIENSGRYNLAETLRDLVPELR
jgi:outer membrane cobalamin receptor